MHKENKLFKINTIKFEISTNMKQSVHPATYFQYIHQILNNYKKIRRD